MKDDIPGVVRTSLERAWERYGGQAGTRDEHLNRFADAVLAGLATIEPSEDEPCTRPHLGLASTAEMLIELLLRAKIEMAINVGEPAEIRLNATKMEATARKLLAELPADMLAYRPDDPDDR